MWVQRATGRLTMLALGPSRHLALPQDIGRLGSKADMHHRVTPPSLLVPGLILLQLFRLSLFYHDVICIVAAVCLAHRILP